MGKKESPPTWYLCVKSTYLVKDTWLQMKNYIRCTGSLQKYSIFNLI